MDRDQLINKIINLDQKANQLFLEFKSDNWIKLDLSIDQLKTLIILNNKGRINFTELAQILGITRSNITGIADRLIKNGFAVRYQNPEDRRIQFLILTEKGKRIIDDLKQQSITEVTRILNYMNIDDLAAFEKGLSAFIQAGEVYIKSIKVKTEVEENDPELN